MAPQQCRLYPRLAKEVENYRCIYDKKDNDYKKLPQKLKAWHEIVKNVGFKNGKEAKNKWYSLKKLYYNIKRELKDATRSGQGVDETGADDPAIVKIKQRLSDMDYVKWIEGFQNMREQKSTITQYDSSSDEDDMTDIPEDPPAADNSNTSLFNGSQEDSLDLD